MSSEAFLLYTHGDPIGTSRRFLEIIWKNGKMDKILVPPNGNIIDQPNANLLDSPEQIASLNPFKPLMTTNVARFIPAILRDYPDTKLGAILKPCEIRALQSMRKMVDINVDNLLTIGFDCLGTYPNEEYQWFVNKKGLNDSLEQTSLQFARQGGILSYRFRAACQICTAPNAQEADINIEVLGLPVRQFILIRTENPSIIDEYKLHDITDGIAEDLVVHKRDWMLAKISERNGRVRERIKKALYDVLPTNVDEFIIQLNECDTCQSCVSVCPICQLYFPKRDSMGSYQREEILNWIFSCVGCGMCEQVCPKHHPLSVIFGYLRELIQDPASLRSE